MKRPAAFACRLPIAVMMWLGAILPCRDQTVGSEDSGPRNPGLQAPAEEPPAPDDGAGAGDKTRDIVRVAQPWLRINSGGHSATVQALAFTADSRRLCSAGLDKVVQVWDLAALPANVQLRDIRRAMVRERTIRWQVSRGPRGSVFALAGAPSDGLLALAGYGAMGSTGEILLVKPADGSLVQVLEGHRQTVCTLAFSRDGNTLVSADTDGECRTWRRGAWNSTVLQAADGKTYGPAIAARIQRLPLLRPVAVVRSEEVILPVCTSAAGAAKLQWQLQRFSLDRGQILGRLPMAHAGLVTSLASTRDGQHLASADLDGNLYFWNLPAVGEPSRLATGNVVKSLAFSPDGKNLAVGTAVSSASGHSVLQFWDIAALKLASSRTLADHVHAVAYSPDGKKFAYVGGGRNEVFVDRLNPSAKSSAALAGGSRKVLTVAFAAEQPFYQVAFGTKERRAAFNDAADLEETFDPSHSRLGKNGSPPAGHWLPKDWMAGAWNVRRSADASQLQLYEGAAARGIVQLDPQTQGHARCSCWIPNEKGQPAAIAVGTDTQNLICVFALSPHGVCPLLRQFRGHQDFVASLAISRDLRYLVSGSADGTMQFWPLQDYQRDPSAGRWGGSFRVADERLLIQELPEAGPLFRKGLRQGDRITGIRWWDGRRERTENAPQVVLDRLRDVAWGTQVEFSARRASGVPRTFQLVPAWQALASLYVSEDREWAFWTPEGYYDASANGHTLFGWQVNRGLRQLPDFYRADQFRRTLERPAVLRQLLVGGSLESALSTAGPPAATSPENILAAQVAATPLITILAPQPGQVVKDREVVVRAKIMLPAGTKLRQTRVFASGVVAPQARQIGQRQDAATGGQELTFEWHASLPNEARGIVQVAALTDAGTAASERVLIEKTDLPPAAAPRLYTLAIGVDNYQDPGIEKLGFPVADATSLAATFQSESGELYEIVEPIVLTNEAVTRARWKSEFAALTKRLKNEARPDDLLVLFLAGHGEIDPRTQTYHYICQNAQLENLLGGTDTISWDDFQPLSDIPCRKLALLDTCHSGAIQGVRQEYKSAMREFQENLVFTVAAAADDEPSQERREWQHGAFTKSLLEALAGAADESQDGVVTLHELFSHTQRVVTQLTGDAQHPTAAPRELFEFVAVPLASRRDGPRSHAAASLGNATWRAVSNPPGR